MSAGDNKNFEVKEEPAGLRFVVIEDQYETRLILLRAIYNGFGDKIKNFREDGDVRLIDNLADANALIAEGDLAGVVVLLDHNIYLTPPDRSGQEPKKGVFSEKYDTKGFTLYDDPPLLHKSDAVQGVGYTLANSLKKKGAIVIGTSSMDGKELGSAGVPELDFAVQKSYGLSLADIKESVLQLVSERRRVNQPPES